MKNNNSSVSVTKKTVTWIVRCLCGSLFLFAGFVKAIDPWGTIFKMNDYFAVIGFNIPEPLVRLFVFALCAVEFVVGCFLILGCFRKSSPIIAALIMCCMLPFTLWVALYNPVPDCGCFGDAFQISNWATFIKNLLLSAGIVWLLFNNLSCICLITPAFQWLAIVFTGAFILAIELIGYYYQPLLDFRDYPIGGELFADSEETDSGPEYLFEYEKDGERREFTIDNLPDEDDGWIYVGRKEKESAEFEKPGLMVFDVVTGEEMTDEIANSAERQLIVMIPDVVVVSPATTWKLNSLYEWSLSNGVEMVGIVSGSRTEIENWEDLSMASYPVYEAEDTMIKEIVRGNPGIIYLINGRIIWKSSLSSIDVDDFQSSDVGGDASSFGRDNSAILRNFVLGYLILICLLIFISFTPRMARLLTRSGLASHKGVKNYDLPVKDIEKESDKKEGEKEKAEVDD